MACRFSFLAASVIGTEYGFGALRPILARGSLVGGGRLPLAQSSLDTGLIAAPLAAYTLAFAAVAFWLFQNRDIRGVERLAHRPAAQ